MKNLFGLLMLGIIVFSGSMFAQEKRIRRDDLIVRAQVVVTQVDSGYLRFRYEFRNDQSSHQSMTGIYVDLNDDWQEYGGSVKNVVPPSEKNWGKFPSVGEKIRWVTYYDTTGIDVMEYPPRSVILPGEQLSFSFESRGLPGIGMFYAEGWAPWFFTMEQEDSLIREGYNWEKSRALDKNFFKGRTIVRRSPPDSFIHLAFLDTLFSYTRQSAELGWLGKGKDEDCDKDERPEDGIVRNIELRLQKAQRELERGAVKARKELETLVAKVERIWKRSEKQSGKRDDKDRRKEKSVIMTSEAYAILKFNTEYLIERLPAN